MKKLLCIAFLFLSLFLTAKEIPPVPKTYIQDNTGIVEQPYWDTINELLADLERKTGVQFLVYVDDSLNGEVLETYVTKMFNAWELGKNGKNNGMLLAVFIKDRSFRIEIGYGLEGKIPDLLSYRYQEKYLIPRFKELNYGQGIMDCSKALADAASGYVYDFFGEKKQRLIDSLIIVDEARALTMNTKEMVITELHTGYTYLAKYDDYFLYYYISSASDTVVLKDRMGVLWAKISDLQEAQANKILIGLSTKQPIFLLMGDKNLEAPMQAERFIKILETDGGKYIIDEWKNGAYYYVLNFCKTVALDNIDYNAFKDEHPIYILIFSPFVKSKNDLMWSYWDNIVFAVIMFALLFPLLLIWLLIFINRELKLETKSILFVWSLLNYFIPFVGFIVQLFLLAKVIKLFRKKGNYKNKIKTINEKSYFGYFTEFFKSSGGGSSTYSSSGKSWSSGSSSRSSYSSGSSSSYSSGSSSSFGGGGGGRSGGGGSSGKW